MYKCDKVFPYRGERKKCKMKRIVSLILAIIMVLSMGVSVFASENMRNVTIDAARGTFEWKIDSNAEKETVTIVWLEVMIGETIGTYYPDATISDPVLPGYTFEGWICFEGDGTLVTYPNTDIYRTYETEWLLNVRIPRSPELTFVAKWEEIPIDYYSVDGLNIFGEVIDEPDMQIFGNDGRFVVTNIFDAVPWETDGYGMDFKEGESFKSKGATITDPVFWNPERKFSHWEALCETIVTDGEYTWSDWVEIEPGKKLTTAQMIDYKKPAGDKPIMFRAVWEGDDEDYYSYVSVMNFEGGFTLVLNELEEIQDMGCGYRFHEGYSIEDQTDSFEIKDIVNPNNYTFEGWVCVEDSTGAIFAAEGEEYHLYTSEDIASQEVGESDITYYAKWEELSLEECIYGWDDPEGPGAPEEFEDNLFFDCYGGTFVLTDGQDAISGDFLSGYFEVGECLDDQYVYFDGDIVREGYTFEGWLEFNIDEEKFVDSTKLWSNEEIIFKPHPEYNVCYIAKWAEIPFSQYVYGEGNEELAYRNIGFDANGGRNEDIVLDANGERIGGSSEITQWAVDENKCINDILSEYGYSYATHVPYKDGIKSESWTLIQADSIMWKEYILGTTYTRAENEAILYGEVLGAYYRYLVGVNAYIISTNAKTEDIFEIADDKSYYAIANWGTVTEVVVPGSDNEYVTNEVPEVKVPENLPEEVKEKFDTTEKIENELSKELEETGLVKEESQIVFMEVSLLTKNDEGEYVPVDNESFPEEGIEITIAFPEGTDAEGFEFVVAHLKNNGEIEILVPKVTENGLVIKVNSLSPFAVLYNEKTEDKEVYEEYKPNPGVTDILERDKVAESNPNTGAPIGSISIMGAVSVLAVAAFVCGKK